MILAGADEQSVRHLARLTAVYRAAVRAYPLVRAFSRLTEDSARHLDTRHTALPAAREQRPEALRAAEHIGLERRFVAGAVLPPEHSVSRSRHPHRHGRVGHPPPPRRTEGEAVTHTTGTTSGQEKAYSEAEVPRQQQQVNVHVEDRRPREDNRGDSGRQEDRRGDRAQEPGQRPAPGGRGGSGGDAGGIAGGRSG